VLNTGGVGIGERAVVDTKAMRKLDLGDVIFAVAQVTELGAATMRVFFDSRLLVMLP